MMMMPPIIDLTVCRWSVGLFFLTIFLRLVSLFGRICRKRPNTVATCWPSSSTVNRLRTDKKPQMTMNRKETFLLVVSTYIDEPKKMLTLVCQLRANRRYKPVVSDCYTIQRLRVSTFWMQDFLLGRLQLWRCFQKDWGVFVALGSHGDGRGPMDPPAMRLARDTVRLPGGKKGQPERQGNNNKKREKKSGE